MKLSSQIIPISALKAHAAEIVRPPLSTNGAPLINTKYGESKVVPQDIESHEGPQETTALLKILALGTRQIEEGRVQPVEEVFQRSRDRGTHS